MPQSAYIVQLTELRDLCNEYVFDEGIPAAERKRFLFQAQNLTLRLASLRAERFEQNTAKVKDATKQLERVNEELKKSVKDLEKVNKTLEDIGKVISVVDEVIAFVKKV